MLAEAEKLGNVTLDVCIFRGGRENLFGEKIVLCNLYGFY